MELKELKGVGPQTLKKLQNAGIFTAEDLISRYPRDYMSYDPALSPGELEEEKVVTVYGYFLNPPVTRRFNGQQITTGVFTDGMGRITVNWYHMPYIAASITGNEMYLRGRVMKKGRQWVLYQPAILKEEQYLELLNRLMPVYPLKTGLTNKLMTSLVSQCLEQAELVREYLPESFRRKYQLAEANYAVRNIHFPESRHDMLLARKRLVFDEFFFFMLSVRELKEQKQKSRNCFRFGKQEAGRKLLESLPYSLTGAQRRTLEEIYRDMGSDHLMNRLVQGDVGSGKTIVAFLAMIYAAENGYQSALMAPTEVLAVQHYESLCRLLEQSGLDFQIVLLTGSMTAKQKREACKTISAHEADMIIGTHALIQEKVVYDDLALVITDEQHRFGVRQRAVFAGKAAEEKKPHVLVMSATPIPRTLALILYGDLDISVIDELPANRIPIKNCVVDTAYLPKAYAFIEKEVRKGRQAYVICSMVEESEQIQAENVTDYTEKLREALSPDIRIGLLHGKMKAKEKKAVMMQFAGHELDVLVSTTVVEVGVNVPNATVMMIENAERFGLSQLHQLRGRVGRGAYQSYCIFMDRSGRKEKSERLSVLEKSNDGFFIASEDLRLRGPGDFYGVRQNGQLQFALADIYTDAAVMKQAREAADEIYEKQAEMTQEEEKQLQKLLSAYQEKAAAADVPL
ncbi:MAG: ATP-dependent DNA helicase RecG [Lachnospiraceae bacterium]|nr:ATP-dependent DNA helicase RecG [Lachnospiraceae bacterium]MDY4970264.1 ATP-dependent DNA helicase RecG [Lachnospiraceae bacterium]